MSEPLKPHEHFKLFRDYLQHEDDLIAQRISWNWTIQGFLVTAYALSLQKILEVSQRIHSCIPTKDVPCPDPFPIEQLTGYHALAMLVRWMIPMIGFFVSGASIIGVLAARKAIEQLEQDWLK